MHLIGGSLEGMNSVEWLFEWMTNDFLERVTLRICMWRPMQIFLWVLCIYKQFESPQITDSTSFWEPNFVWSYKRNALWAAGKMLLELGPGHGSLRWLLRYKAWGSSGISISACTRQKVGMHAKGERWGPWQGGFKLGPECWVQALWKALLTLANPNH